MRRAQSITAGFGVAVFLLWACHYILATSTKDSAGVRYYSLADDAMISMRYAWNLAHGNGLVWNAGERVEGYTNPLVTLVMAVPQLWLEPRRAVLFLQLLGIALCLLAAGLAARVVTRFSEDDWAPVIAFLLTLTYPLLAGQGLSGSDTVPYALALIAAYLSTVATCRGPRSSLFWRLGLVYAALPLIRPEAAVAVAVLLAFLVWRLPTVERRRALPVVVAVIVLIDGGHLVWRHAYYGHWLPNTAVLKLSGFPLVTRWQRGARYDWLFLKSIAPAFVLAVAVTLFRRRWERSLALALFGVTIATQLHTGGDYNLYWRLLAPGMPLLLALASDGLVRVGGLFGSAAGALAMAVYFWYPLADFLTRMPSHFLTENVKIALALRQVLKPGATLAVFAARNIPYYLAEYRAIDFLGKSDPRIARQTPRYLSSLPNGPITSAPGHNKYDLAYSIGERQPTFIEGATWGGSDYSAWVRQHYVRASVGDVSLWLKRDAPEVAWDKVARLTH